MSADMRHAADHYTRLLADFNTFFKAAPASVSAQASSHHPLAVATAQPPNPISGSGGNSFEDATR